MFLNVKSYWLYRIHILFYDTVRTVCELSVCVLTGNIEVDQPLVFAHFVFSRAHIQDRNAGIAYLKPAHYLLGEKRRMSWVDMEEGCCHRVEPTVKTHIGATDSNQSLRV